MAGDAGGLLQAPDGAQPKGPLRPQVQQLGAERLLQAEARLERRTCCRHHGRQPRVFVNERLERLGSPGLNR